MFYIGPPIRKVEFIYGENLREQAQKSNTPPLVSGNFFAFFWEKISRKHPVFCHKLHVFREKSLLYRGIIPFLSPHSNPYFTTKSVKLVLLFRRARFFVFCTGKHAFFTQNSSQKSRAITKTARLKDSQLPFVIFDILHEKILLLILHIKFKPICRKS